ncbi:MAG TPA: hypothetical protein VF748_07575 [Candidatus Acidoferrum sp.]
MLWSIRLAFLVLVLLFVLAAVTACTRREEVRWGEPVRVEPLVAPRAVGPEVLAAETRRAQVIAEIARLSWVLRHTPAMENRIALELAISDRRAEVERLNALISASAAP